MATFSRTVYTTLCKYGYYEWGYTSGWSIGYSSGHDFRGILRFPDLNLRDAVIRKISLLLRRTDTYSGKDNYLGFNQNTAWNATTVSDFHVYISSGTGTKTIDLTPYISLIQGYVGDWCIIANRDTTGEFCSFDGDEDGANAPRLVVEYDRGMMHYYKDGAFKECGVHYFKDGAYKQCLPYVYRNGLWVLV
jgi:hypothetical protein